MLSWQLPNHTQMLLLLADRQQLLGQSLMFLILRCRGLKTGQGTCVFLRAEYLNLSQQKQLKPLID
jgi:hypothetical protein